MTLGQYAALSRIIWAARRHGRITPADAEAMLAHIVDPDPKGSAARWQLVALILGVGLLLALVALMVTT